ncbi:putative surface layer protein [Rhizodiscina lignyota]|uniref:Surface layer protein n=1 Tax=Rhizodiscina lignyota TaxID=1504668 RepID=A0A9P4ICK8_9PEZI|nr:putative surface layer protein [Rhizodiscina lignyota]
MSDSANVAVISQSGETLSFFDATTGQQTQLITDLIAEPHELCVDKHRNVMYISHAYRHGHYWKHGDYSHEISVFDLKERRIVDVINIAPYGGSHGIRLDAANDRLISSVEYGIGEAGGAIGIDLKTRKVIGSVGSDAKSHWIIITPDGKKAYTCNKTFDFVSVLNLADWKLIKKITLPGGSEELDISRDGKFVYVPAPGAQVGQNPADPCIKVIDTQTDEIVDSIPLAFGGSSVHVTPRGTIMVGQYNFKGGKLNRGHVSLFEPKNYKLLGDVEITDYPLTLRSSADGSVGYAANVLGGTTDVIDLDNMKVLRNFEVDTVSRADKGNMCQGAHGLAVFH